MSRTLKIAVSLFLLAGLLTSAQAGEKFITIGTAGELGVYYPAGGAICRLVKRGIKEHGIKCFVEQTTGSVYNLKALRDGEVDLAVAQTDWIYNASKGTSDFAGSGQDTSLRSVFSLFNEAFTVLVRSDSGIGNIRDLAGKRIAIGADGSGMRATAEEFIKAEGWTKDSFAALDDLKPQEQGDALCSGKVDAILSIAAQPNGGMQEITHKCATHLVSVEGPAIEKLLKDNPYYQHITLPGGMYPGSAKNINTFGMKATLVTSSKVDEEIIYQVVKAVFTNLDNFKTLHPVFSALDQNKMITEGLIVPMHLGAIRYYREIGLIK